MFSLTDAFTLGISRIRMAGHQWSSTAVLGPLGPAGIDARPGQETGDWRLETPLLRAHLWGHRVVFVTQTWQLLQNVSCQLPSLTSRPGRTECQLRHAQCGPDRGRGSPCVLLSQPSRVIISHNGDLVRPPHPATWLEERERTGGNMWRNTLSPASQPSAALPVSSGRTARHQDLAVFSSPCTGCTNIISLLNIKLHYNSVVIHHWPLLRLSPTLSPPPTSANLGHLQNWDHSSHIQTGQYSP